MIFWSEAEREAEREQAGGGWCVALFEAGRRAGHDDRFDAIDKVFTSLVGFELHLDIDHGGKGEAVVTRACDLMSRLLEVPVSLADIEPATALRSSSFPTHFRIPLSTYDEEWNTLSVVTRPSTNTIHLALAIETDIFWVQDYRSSGLSICIAQRNV